MRFIGTGLRARPLLPFHRKKPPLAQVRPLVWYRLSYAARAVIERGFAAATRSYGWDTRYAVGGAAVRRQVPRTHCAILGVALVAQQAGAPEPRRSPTRVLAHYQPIQATL